MSCDPAAASQNCAFFSATGILFMTWVGVMLMKQPFYIGGIEDVERAKSSAFGAAATFLFTFVVSIAYMIMDAQKLTRNGGMASASSSLAETLSARQLPNPFSGRPGGSVFHAYDPVDTDTPDEFEFEDRGQGVMS